jgi:hypothetical protein
MCVPSRSETIKLLRFRLINDVKLRSEARDDAGRLQSSACSRTCEDILPYNAGGLSCITQCFIAEIHNSKIIKKNRACVRPNTYNI